MAAGLHCGNMGCFICGNPSTYWEGFDGFELCLCQNHQTIMNQWVANSVEVAAYEQCKAEKLAELANMVIHLPPSDPAEHNCPFGTDCLCNLPEDQRNTSTPEEIKDMIAKGGCAGEHRDALMAARQHIQTILL